MMENSLKTFSSNGATLHYLQQGQGPALLFIPGSISDFRTWTDVFPRFTKDFTCYVLSRRYQYPAKYPPNGDGSVELNTEDIANFIRVNQLAPVNLLAHSYGGFIALNLAIKYPELVKDVVAEEPIFAPALVKNPKNPLELLGLLFRNFKAGKSFARLGMKGIEPTFKALAEGDLVSAQKTFIDGVSNGKKTPETLDELSRAQLSDNIAALAGEDPFNNKIKLKDVEAIKARVLLLSGTESPPVFAYIAQSLARKIPQARHQQFEGADHWMHLGQQEDFISRVESFLKEG